MAKILNGSPLRDVGALLPDRPTGRINSTNSIVYLNVYIRIEDLYLKLVRVCIRSLTLS